MPLLVIAEPQPYILIIVGEVEGAGAMLLVLKPFSLVLLSVGERVDPIALPLSLHVLALVSVAVLVHRASLSVGTARDHFALVLSAVAGGATAKGYLLRRGRQRKCKQE